jgi:hypothetical protein
LGAIGYELERVCRPDPSPEIGYAADEVGLSVDDVVKGDDATPANKIAIELEVAPDALPSVVAVDEEHVDLATAQLFLDARAHGCCMRVAVEEVNTLLVACERLEEWAAVPDVPAAESEIRARREVDGDEDRVRLSDSREQEQCPAAPSPDLEHRSWVELLYEDEKSAQLGPDLVRGEFE